MASIAGLVVVNDGYQQAFDGLIPRIPKNRLLAMTIPPTVSPNRRAIWPAPPFAEISSAFAHITPQRSTSSAAGVLGADDRPDARGRQLDCGPSHYTSGVALLLTLGCLLAYWRDFTHDSSGLPACCCPSCFDTSAHQVMGRRVAGSFAQGLASSLKQGDQLTVFMGSRKA